MAEKSGADTSGAATQSHGRNRLRSRRWFDEPLDPALTALYIERYLNFGLTREELQGGKPIIGIAQTGSDISPCNRHHIELATRCATASATPAASRSNSRSTRSRKPASDRPPHSTATSPTCRWWKCCTAIRSTA